MTKIATMAYKAAMLSQAIEQIGGDNQSGRSSPNRSAPPRKRCGSGG